MLSPTIRVFPDPDSVARHAADWVIAAARQALADRGRFSLVLSGGSTPQSLYQLLAGEAFRSQMQWHRVHVYFADERCVPPDHPDSNYGMVNRLLLDPVEMPAENIRRMRGEIEPEAAAREYGQMLKDRFGDFGPDLTILGMGADGHTASLFPGTAALSETHHRCVASYVARLAAWRLTLTAPMLNRSDQVLVLVTGTSKAPALQQALEGPEDPMRLPIQLVRPSSGRMTWLLDAAAAGM